MKKVHKSSGTDDKKLQTSLKKMNVQPIQAIEEVNMFKEDGNVIHFAAPKGTLFSDLLDVFLPLIVHISPPLASTNCPPALPTSIVPQSFTCLHNIDPQLTLTHTQLVHASVPSNTFAIYGQGEDKELTELVPGILNQLGPDSLASLRKLAESYQSMQKKDGDDGEKKDDDDDDIPDLVPGETFDSKVE
ncbi:Nascent polypeptide-associated complex subunit beta [Lambiella insularis]|nr:Nascent polypeptide-associated complex subunit beta [Lambiella insularis]